MTKHTFTDPDGRLWFKEALMRDVGNGMRIDALIYEHDSEHQHIMLFENSIHGRVLANDGIVQVARSDEFIYHEMVTHVPVLAHGSVKRVCVVGGGDGGACRELLRHKDIEEVVLVEIDPDVVEFSKKWLPEVSNGAFEDPRLKLVIADGVKYMAEGEDRFDVIIIDSTDPIGPAAGLFTPEFYASCKARLTERGVLVTQNGLPALQPDELADNSKAFAKLFRRHGFYLITVPAFAGGAMALGFATDAGDVLDPSPEDLETRFKAAGITCRYYNPAVHKGAFALPTYVRDLMAAEAR